MKRTYGVGRHTRVIPEAPGLQPWGVVTNPGSPELRVLPFPFKTVPRQGRVPRKEPRSFFPTADAGGFHSARKTDE